MKQSELHQQERAVDDALAFAAGLPQGAPEQAMLARYVCVLASGFLENIVRTRLTEFVRQSKPKNEIKNYVEDSVDDFQNPKFEKISDIAGQFNKAWKKQIEELDDRLKHTINSIVANRHQIAHGRQPGVSLGQVKEYVQRAKEFMGEFNRICR